jgi:hypothetical protein
MTAQGAEAADLELTKPAAAADAQFDETLARLVVGLPLEKRLQVEGLLVDLGAKIDPSPRSGSRRSRLRLAASKRCDWTTAT